MGQAPSVQGTKRPGEALESKKRKKLRFMRVSDLNVRQLQDKLRQVGLPVSGKKKELIKRYCCHLTTKEREATEKGKEKVKEMAADDDEPVPEDMLIPYDLGEEDEEEEEEEEEEDKDWTVPLGKEIGTYDWVVHFDDFESINEGGCGISLAPHVHSVLERLLRESGIVMRKGENELLIPTELLDSFTLRDDFSVVSVLGLFDKGKTWLLNKLCNVSLPVGHTTHTEGLSFKIPPGVGEADSNVVLLDTAGGYSPVRDASLRAIGMKKQSETFLKEVAIRLSDKVFVVVNELTWPDQEFIEALLAKFNNYSQFQNEFVVVVHNFKEIASEEELEKQIQFYIKSCYNVIERTKAWSEDPTAVARWYDVVNSKLSHVVLAKEESEAGKLVNGPTIRLLQEWMWKKVIRRPPLIRRLIDLSLSVLSGFTSNLSGIDLYACYDLAYPFILKSRASGALITREPRIADGTYSITFANAFTPKADTLKLPNGALLVIVELPGYSIGGGITKPDELEFDFKFDIDREELLIWGPKKLCYIPYDFEGDKWVLKEDERISYREGDTFNMNQREGNSSSWQVRIPLPRTFESTYASLAVRNGILQMVVLPRKVGTDVNIILS